MQLRGKLTTHAPKRSSVSCVAPAGVRWQKIGLVQAASAHAPAETAGQEAKIRSTKVAVYSAQQYVKDFLQDPVMSQFPDSMIIEAQLDKVTASLAKGCQAVIVFVNDICTDEVVEQLAEAGVKLIALRCAGYDRVDLAACEKYGVRVARVPTYSPQSVAEHAVALMFALNRKLPASFMRVTQGNYALSGLVGFQMFGKTVGIIGTGAIGTEAVRILKGIGCKVIAHDLHHNPAVLAMGVEYQSLDEMLPQCDIVSLHCPLLNSTTNLINRDRLKIMKPGVMLINVSRGGLVDSEALLDALESGQIGALGLDVYDQEGDLFFRDFTVLTPADRMKAWNRSFKLLLTYPQVLVTPHSAFLTTEALDNIASTTIQNISNFVLGKELGGNEVFNPMRSSVQ